MNTLGTLENTLGILRNTLVTLKNTLGTLQMLKIFLETDKQTDTETTFALLKNHNLEKSQKNWKFERAYRTDLYC